MASDPLCGYEPSVDVEPIVNQM